MEALPFKFSRHPQPSAIGETLGAGRAGNERAEVVANGGARGVALGLDVKFG
jgi:hypothetical protein